VYKKQTVKAYNRPPHWMEMGVQLHAPAALLPGKELLLPLDKRLGVPTDVIEKIKIPPLSEL
jgi:hypothetical protein